ncbi:uncharacterized protein LOC119103732 [Pollicipes pollicipes]|uniref:uncharacterized protein LOC119103732 n=1 Tax=Pollicipes pollicipes TaxID=41117 RepID=UPI001884EBEB|nr:uncharacterized protein LOC119103732 [Pollicipes pollicipes]
MGPLLVLATVGVATAAGYVQKCHVCKTENAAELFANLHCDEIPPSAPDCSLFAKGGRDFHQPCPADSHCMTITKEAEELRICTQKPRLDTTETTDGIMMTVCGSNMCNAAGPRLSLAATALLLSLAACRLV